MSVKGNLKLKSKAVSENISKAKIKVKVPTKNKNGTLDLSKVDLKNYISNPSDIKERVNYISNYGLAQLAGVSSTAVGNNKALQKIKTEFGFDPNHPLVIAYIAGHKKNIKQGRESRAIKSAATRGIYPGDLLDDMKAKKKEDPVANIQYQHELEKYELTKEKRIKQQLDNLEKKKQLTPFEIVSLWISVFTGSLQNNFLTLDKRIARGDRELQKRVREEVKNTIRMSLEHARSELKRLDFKDFENLQVDDE